MKPEKRLLIHDLLESQEGDARRAATLLAGRHVFRHRRWRRAAGRIVVVAVAIAAAAVSLHIRNTTQSGTLATVPTPAAAIPALTDEQLLALFPNTPVALAKVGNKKVLIFPREADREKYVGSF